MRGILFLVVAMTIFQTTAGANSPIVKCEDLRQFLHNPLNAYQDRVDAASRLFSIEQWKVETASPEASCEKVSLTFQTMQKSMYDKAVRANLVELEVASSEINPTACPEKRQLSRARGLLDSLIVEDNVASKEKTNQDLQNRMQTLSNGFRLEIPGEEKPVSRAIYSKILTLTADRTKRESLYRQFNSARAQKWIEWGFRDLLKARNEEGKLAGYPSYYEYRFFRNQLDLSAYQTMLREVKTKLAPKFQKELRALASKANLPSIESWDLGFLRAQGAAGELDPLLKKVSAEAPLDFARLFYTGLGISVDSYGFLMDLFPRPGKNAHAFAMSIVYPRVNEKGELLTETKPDIRFLANLKQPVRWSDISTVIHELGHAIDAAEVRQYQGVFRDIGSVRTEAIAMTFERMAGSKEYFEASLPKLTGISPETLAPILERQLKATRFSQASILLSQLLYSEFELEAYRNPDQDFAALWASLYEQYWGVKVQPAYADWDIEHYVMAPVYLQNYAIGLLMVEQLYESMLAEFHTGFQSKALGDKLKKLYFSPGIEFPYAEMVAQFTGKPLSAEAALKLLDESRGIAKPAPPR